MHLEARRTQTVRWQGGERRFRGGERIHTENSYKYRQSDVIAPAASRPAFARDPHLDRSARLVRGDPRARSLH